MDRQTAQRAHAQDAYRSAMARIARVAQGAETTSPEESEDYAESLAWEERIEVKITLSWGGPSEGFKLYKEADGTVSEGYYFFADWFTYDEFRLTDEELNAVLTVYPVAPI